MSILHLFVLAVLNLARIYNVESETLTYKRHDEVNPFSGVVAWSTNEMPESISMEWAFVGMSKVLPNCKSLDSLTWKSVDAVIRKHARNGHHTILRPIIFGPGYGKENYKPRGMPFRRLEYDGKIFKNPKWETGSVKRCVTAFIKAFAARYRDNKRVAVVQMGLFGLWGEHHLDSAAPYNGKNFPSPRDQAKYIRAFLKGFRESPSDVSLGISLDSTQPHGPFEDFPALLGRRFHFFDDTLLEKNHGFANNWRQDALPTKARLAQQEFGMGGEFFWSGCNSNGDWSRDPYDCGNGESLSDQAARLHINYVLGSPAVTDGKSGAASVLEGSRSIGWELTVRDAEAVSDSQLKVTISNPGIAPLPQQASICATTLRGSDLSCATISLLVPGASETVTIEVTGGSLPSTIFLSIRMTRGFSKQQAPLFSNVGASKIHRDVEVDLKDNGGGDDGDAVTGTGLLVPLYIYPDSWNFKSGQPWSWEPYIRSAKADAKLMVIINANSGPGDSVISDYTKALFNDGGLLNSGATILCYIATEYGQKDITIAKRELELWEEFYPGACDGFFFDEASSSASELLYYEELAEFARTKVITSAQVVLNPGAPVQDDDYYRIADVILSFENTCASYATSGVPEGQASRDSSQHALAIHSCAEGADVSALVLEARERNYGWVFLTDDVMPNPWDQVPSFWQDLVDSVAA